MTDREVEAISDFLQHFGSFGCRQICVRRSAPRPRTPEEVGAVVLETLARWRAEGLDAERLYQVATIAVHFDAYKLQGSVCPRAAGSGAHWHPPVRPVRAARSRARSSSRPCSAQFRSDRRRRRTRRCPTTWMKISGARGCFRGAGP